MSAHITVEHEKKKSKLFYYITLWYYALTNEMLKAINQNNSSVLRLFLSHAILKTVGRDVFKYVVLTDRGK